jgi:hypothetical protein
MPQLEAALQQAGTTARIAPSEIESAAAGVKLEGHAQATRQSALGGVALLELEVTGLDRAIAIARALLGPDDAGGAKALDLLRLASHRERAADGRAVDRYVLVLSREGEISVNDKPIDSLLQ